MGWQSGWAGEIRKLAAPGAKIVIIPEKTAIAPDSDMPEVDLLFRPVAVSTGASIVIGIERPTSGARWNEARLYAPDGTIRTYEKNHLLPGADPI